MFFNKEMSFNSDIDISDFKVIDLETISEINNEFISKYTEIPH